MKKLKLVGILVAVVLIGGVISISFINNNIAYKVEKELCETPLPEKTELIESISRAGKLTGNGNGMQYFGAILIQSELSLKELDDYYSDHRSNEWEYLVEIQEGQSIDVIDHETLNFGKEINDAGYYIVYSWESENSLLKELDIRGLLWSSFFVTLVAKKIVLINLCYRPCFIWGSITIITVWTNMIIINVCKFFYLLIECFLCCKLIQICAFILQGIEVTLHRCIVVRIPCFAHALCHIYRFAEFGKCFGRIL